MQTALEAYPTLTLMEDTELRAQLEQYQIRDGLIASPGKFEGEPLYVPFLWDAIMNGGGEPVGTCKNDNAEQVSIDTHDQRIFPELQGVQAVILWEDDQGFVHHTLSKENFQVVVGNVGTVYMGNDRIEAERIFAAYQDGSHHGRARGEDIVLMNEDEVLAEGQCT